MILNHFIKGRLYGRDLIDGAEFETVGGKTVKISKDSSNHISVDRAKIVEAEVFVYNLGTMFYIDDVLHPIDLQNDFKPNEALNSDLSDEVQLSEEAFTTEIPIMIEKLSTKSNREPTTLEYRSTHFTTRDDVEFVPSINTGFSDDIEDFSTSDSYVTPKALPSRYHAPPPKK
jgi:hypothetical protein